MRERKRHCPGGVAQLSFTMVSSSQLHCLLPQSAGGEATYVRLIGLTEYPCLPAWHCPACSHWRLYALLRDGGVEEAAQEEARQS